MSNLATNERLKFDTELTVAAPFTGVAQAVGTLSNIPVIILFKNQSTVSVFVSDNTGPTNGTTMVAGEEFVLDCRSNAGRAFNMGFPIGTTFSVTGTGGTGNFKISMLYAA